MKALIVTGSRYGINLTNKEVDEFMSKCLKDIDLVIHGNAEGVDLIFDEYAKKNNIQVLKMPAQWEKHGNAAGPLRNVEMIKIATSMRKCGWKLAGLALPGKISKGTRGCMKLIEKENIPLVVLEIGKDKP